MYEDYEYMLSQILDWAKSNSRFDDTTMRGIRDNYEEYGAFTTHQEDAIRRVYYSWKVDQW